MLADYSQLSRVHVSDIERGKIDVSIMTLEKIVLGMEITLDEFFVGL